MDKSTLGVYHGRRVPTPSLANARPFARRHPTRRNPVPPLNTPASPTIGDVFVRGACRPPRQLTGDEVHASNASLASRHKGLVVTASWKTLNKSLLRAFVRPSASWRCVGVWITVTVGVRPSSRGRQLSRTKLCRTLKCLALLKCLSDIAISKAAELSSWMRMGVPICRAPSSSRRRRM